MAAEGVELVAARGVVDSGEQLIPPWATLPSGALTLESGGGVCPLEGGPQS